MPCCHAIFAHKLESNLPQARSDLAKSDEQWFAQLRLEVERVTRAHMQVWNVVMRHGHPITCLQEMDQCERRLQDARAARDGDRAEQTAAMAAANLRILELQKTVQLLQVSLHSVNSSSICKRLTHNF